jgi:hypothetical protein
VLRHDGETAVLVDEAVVRLSEISSAIYDLCVTTVDVTTVAARLHEQFGEPADATMLDATNAAIAEMIAAGVLDEAP